MLIHTYYVTKRKKAVGDSSLKFGVFSMEVNPDLGKKPLFATLRNERLQ